MVTPPGAVTGSAGDPTTNGSSRRAGWSATAALSGALGLCLVAGAFALSRMGRGDGLDGALFWSGFVVLLLPVAWRLHSTATSRRDRILLVALTALLTYAVKVLHDPVTFGLSDEFVHLSATQHLVNAGALFQPSAITGSDIASGFPGLHAATASLSLITGLPLFASGLLVIGAARLVMLLTLFYLFEALSQSPRIAGIGALLYAGAPNFLFWSAQFSYQSLALPLFVVALLMVIGRPDHQGAQRIALSVTAIVVTAAVVATHHLTAYVFAATLWALSAMSLRSQWRQSRAFRLALIATIAAAAWFFFVADGTSSYLSYIFNRTYDAIGGVSGQGTHRPFETPSGYRPPVLEQIVAFGAVALVFGGVLWGLREVGRRRRLQSAPVILLCLAAVGFLVISPLRLFPGAWETANRAQELMFIGVALLLALAVNRIDATARRPRVARAGLLAGVLLLICGGLIQGWPGPLRLSQPLEVRAGNAVIRPEGLDVAIWATRHLPSNAVYVGDEATGRELAGGGARFAFTGSANGVRQLLSDGTLPRWQRDFLVNHQIDFVVLDRRRISSDNLAAYFFQRADAPDGGYGYYPQGVRTKFERLPQDSRVTDTGNIVVYDVRGLHARPPLCSDLGPLSNAAGITCRTSTHALTVAGSDRIAELPGFRMRELATEVQPYGKGIRITVRVQVQNLSTAPYQPDAGWRHFAMYVGQTQIYRQRRVAGRTDNLDGSNPLAPGAKLEGSLSFQLDHRQAMRFVRDGGQLVIRPPRSQRLFNEEIRGVILLAGPPGKAARVDRARARQCGPSQPSAAASGGGKPC